MTAQVLVRCRLRCTWRPIDAVYVIVELVHAV
jgi:hypothetical protein